MDAGRLDERIEVLRSSGTADAFNATVEVWATIATVWASVQPISDGEKWRAGETLANETSRFTIRWANWVSDVNPRDRISYNGRIWDIQGVKDLDRREYREITATARSE
jgi:hypothetical protein